MNIATVLELRTQKSGLTQKMQSSTSKFMEISEKSVDGSKEFQWEVWP